MLSDQIRGVREYEVSRIIPRIWSKDNSKDLVYTAEKMELPFAVIGSPWEIDK